MYCDKCGSKIPDGSVLCQNCGKLLDVKPGMNTAYPAGNYQRNTPPQANIPTDVRYPGTPPQANIPTDVRYPGTPPQAYVPGGTQQA